MSLSNSPVGAVGPIRHCCQEWEDNRHENSIGTAIHKASGDRYGAESRDTDNEIRFKAAGLFMGQALNTIILRIPYRIFQLCTGDFVHAGRVLGERKWNAAVLRYGINGSQGKAPSFNGIVRKEICWQFVKNIVKIVTYPLAIVAMQFATLLAIISPVPGRRLIALIEEAWSREFFICNNYTMLRVSEFLAFCLQPQRVWRESNIYRCDPYYEEFSLPSVLTTLNKEIELNRGYYRIPLIDEEDTNTKSLLDYLDRVREYQKNVKFISNENEFALQIQIITNNLRTIFHSRQSTFLKKISGQEAQDSLKEAVEKIAIAFQQLERVYKALDKTSRKIANPYDKDLCCQYWTDMRPKGKDGVALYVTNFTRRIIEEDGVSRYVTNSKKIEYPIADSSDSSIRKNAVITFFVQAIFMTCVRIPCRILTLLSGDFIRAGIKIGERKYKIATSPLVKLKGPTPSQKSLIAKEICIQLVKNIVKIATYPLAIIGIQLSTLLALVSPLPGRRMIGVIESAWSRDGYELINDPKPTRAWHFTRFSDILFETCQPIMTYLKYEGHNHFHMIENPDSHPQPEVASRA